MGFSLSGSSFIEFHVGVRSNASISSQIPAKQRLLAKPINDKAAMSGEETRSTNSFRSGTIVFCSTEALDD